MIYLCFNRHFYLPAQLVLAEVLPLAAFWTCHVYGFIMLLLFSHQLIVILWKTKLNKTNE